MPKPDKKILIVEDDSSYLWLLRQGFMDTEFSIVYAQDGQEALKLAQDEKPDLILLDILLPKMDGIAVARHLKESGSKTAIIFLTQMGDLVHINKAVEATKETDYIIKSDLHINQIVERVREKLGAK